MRTIVLMLCLFGVGLSGCTRSWNGYRGTPQTPAQLLRGGDTLDEAAYPDTPLMYRSAATPLDVEAVSKSNNPMVPMVPMVAPVSTALPLQPSEYRRVWMAPHLNRYGDAIHGHYCEILYREAVFKAQRAPKLPPSAPVWVKTDAVQTPPGIGTSPSNATGVSPMNLQRYLQQMGIAQDGG